jgi:hypothetical protein
MKPLATTEDSPIFQNRYSYHSSIRNAIVAFGTLFNGIYVRRKDQDGNTIQSLAVPLSYGPKQKFIQRITEAPTLDTGRATFENILPHLGFEVIGLEYDPSRKVAPMQQIKRLVGGGVAATYVSTPYNLNISLTAWTKNQQDGLQIVEQILPYFCPDFNVPIIELPELGGIASDLQIKLNNVNFTDDYTGNYEQRVALLWEFNFTMKINLYGYVAPLNIIRESIANIYAGMEHPVQGERITVTPNPTDATPDSAYDYVTQFDDLGIV